MTRYYSLTPCEHGETDPHYLNPEIPTGDEAPCLTMACPGGQRRELTGVQTLPIRITLDGTAFVDEQVDLEPGRYLIIPLDG